MGYGCWVTGYGRGRAVSAARHQQFRSLRQLWALPIIGCLRSEGRNFAAPTLPLSSRALGTLVGVGFYCAGRGETTPRKRVATASGPRYLLLWLVLWSAFTLGCAGQAWAGQFDDFAVVSSTMGVQGGRVCVGEASRGDIGCPVYAPLIGADGTVSATRFVGDGSGLTGVSASALSMGINDLTDAIADYTRGSVYAASNAGNLTTTGTSNTAFGATAMRVNTSGKRNNAFGYGALGTNAGGNYNAAFGTLAMASNSSGANNTAMGDKAMQANTTASNNTGIGSGALNSNQTGLNNTAIGTFALYNSTASNNTAVGYSAMSVGVAGSNNTAVGYYALSRVSGTNNVAMGYQAGYGAATNNASSNVAIGYRSGYNFATANNNVLLGNQAGYGISNGSNNIVIGALTNPYSNTGSYQLNIGNVIYGNIGRGAKSLIGVNVVSPTASLEVSGTVSVTVLRVAASAPDSVCSAPGDIGNTRRNPTTGRLQICR